MRNVVADVDAQLEPVKRVDEAFKRSLTQEIYGDPVYRVVKFLNLTDQGFHRLFNITSPICPVTEEDLTFE